MSMSSFNSFEAPAEDNIEIPEVFSDYVDPRDQVVEEEDEFDRFYAAVEDRLGPQVVIPKLYTPPPRFVELNECSLDYYNPLTHFPVDSRFQLYLGVMLPTNVRFRDLALMWLSSVSRREGQHWSTYVVEELEIGCDFHEVPNPGRYFNVEPVCVEIDEPIQIILESFEEEVVDDPTEEGLYEFESDSTFKSVKFPEKYSISQVASILQGDGFNTIYCEDTSNVHFYPTNSRIPNSYELIRSEVDEDRYFDSGLISYLLDVRLQLGIEVTTQSFRLSEPDELASPVEVIIPQDKFASAVLAAEQRGPPRGKPPNDNRSKSPTDKDNPYSRFRNDSKEIDLPLKRQDFIVDATSLNELFDEVEEARAVNGKMNSSIVSNMNSRVARYLERVGVFYLGGQHKYTDLYRLLEVSGAFNSLKRKFKNSTSFVVAMKVWLFRTTLIHDPCDNSFKFIMV